MVLTGPTRRYRDAKTVPPGLFRRAEAWWNRDMVDVIVLSVLALADLGFLIYLRQRRRQRENKVRVVESLAVFVRRENGYELPKRRRLLLKAS